MLLQALYKCECSKGKCATTTKNSTWSCLSLWSTSGNFLLTSHVYDSFHLKCATWGTVRPIEEYDFPRLHPQMYDHRIELKKLVQSVAVAFLDLLQILATAPNSQLRTQRIDDISLLVR